MSNSSAPVRIGSADERETVLVRTPVVNPIATLDAASVDPDGGSLLAVLGSVSREQFERRLAKAGHDPETDHGVECVEFAPSVDPVDSTVPSDGGPVHRDVAGLSMELVRRLDGLAGERGVVDVDSVDPFVSAAGLESAYRFFVIVTARVRAAETPLVARLDPGAVDSVVAETLAEAFDRTVEGPTDGRETEV